MKNNINDENNDPLNYSNDLNNYQTEPLNRGYDIYSNSIQQPQPNEFNNQPYYKSDFIGPTQGFDSKTCYNNPNEQYLNPDYNQYNQQYYNPYYSNQPQNFTPQSNYPNSPNQSQYNSQSNPFSSQAAPTQKNKQKLNRPVAIFLSIMGALFVLFVGAYVSYCVYLNINNHQGALPNILSDFTHSSQQNDNQPSKNNAIDPNGPKLNIEDPIENTKEISAEEVYKKASPSVVGVVVYKDSTADSIGSGIIMSQDGYIITNSHVINNSRDSKVIIVTPQEKEYDAVVVGYDSRTDIAVLKINATGLPTASFGNSDDINVGAKVVAIGNPGGLDFSNTLTQGSISALNRYRGSSDGFVKYIQTDAAINSGSSGGPLLNMYGQVIGINSWKVANYEGMSFAIPINDVKSIIDDIISIGYVKGRVRIGIRGTEVSDYQAAMYNIPKGICIANISNESDLIKNGVKENDIITTLNGTKIESFDEFFLSLSKYKPGDKVNLTIYRPSGKGGGSKTFNVSTSLLEDKGETQK